MFRLRPKPSALGSRSAHAARARRRAAGFTLIEAALTTVIVGVGVLAIVAAQQAYTMKNDWAERTNQGMLLANEVREFTLSLPLHDPITGRSHYGPESGEGLVSQKLTYDDLDDFAGPVGSDGAGQGVTFSPPINGLGETIPDMDGWAQHVVVGNVDPNFIDAKTLLPLGSTDMMRITVTVTYQGPHDAQPNTINTLSWVVTE